MPPAAATVVVETDDAAAVAATVLGSHLVPSAVDVLHPGSVAVLFEGGAAAVAAQVEALRRSAAGRRDGSVWEESRARQGAAQGRARFVPGGLRAFLEDCPRRSSARPRASPTSRIRSAEETVRGAAAPAGAMKERFDPHGVLT